MKIVLASSSPRRKKLLKKIISKFEIVKPREPNHLVKKMNAKKETERMAQFKSEWVALKNPQKIVIGADTLLEFEGEKISKPKNKSEAKKFLKKFRSNKILAYSSVCISRLKPRKKQILWTKKSEIEAKNITGKQIENYLKTKKWVGKAGGFDIMQDPASKWFGSSKQDLHSICGLDIDKLKKEIGKF